MAKSLLNKFPSHKEAISSLPKWLREPSVAKEAPTQWELDWKTLGDLIRNRRKQSGLSLRSAARWMSISPAYLSDLERGLRPWSLARLEDAGNVLDMAERLPNKK